MRCSNDQSPRYSYYPGHTDANANINTNDRYPTYANINTNDRYPTYTHTINGFPTSKLGYSSHTIFTKHCKGDTRATQPG